jgi:hypothetical protein
MSVNNCEIVYKSFNLIELAAVKLAAALPNICKRKPTCKGL